MPNLHQAMPNCHLHVCPDINLRDNRCQPPRNMGSRLSAFGNGPGLRLIMVVTCWVVGALVRPIVEAEHCVICAAAAGMPMVRGHDGRMHGARTSVEKQKGMQVRLNLLQPATRGDEQYQRGLAFEASLQKRISDSPITSTAAHRGQDSLCQNRPTPQGHQDRGSSRCHAGT